MKLYGKPSEGHRDVIGYECNNCGERESGEDIPTGWIDFQEDHYCGQCQSKCIKCGEYFSNYYAEDYFVNGLCEDCQEGNHDGRI